VLCTYNIAYQFLNYKYYAALWHLREIAGAEHRHICRKGYYSGIKGAEHHNICRIWHLREIAGAEHRHICRKGYYSGIKGAEHRNIL